MGTKDNETRETFAYTYSATEQKELRDLRAKYAKKPAQESDALASLRRLDHTVERAGTIAGIAMGLCSVLMFGLGLTCILAWGEHLFAVGIVVGIVGLAGMGMATPLCQWVRAKRRKAVAPEALRLLDEIEGRPPTE